MKKLGTVLALVLACACLLSISAFAAGGSLSISTKDTVEPGEEFTVTVNMNSTGVLLMDVTVSYDASVLDFVSKTVGTFVPNNTDAIDSTGAVNFSLGNDLATENVVGEGMLVTVTFKAKDDAAGKSAAITAAATYACDADFADVIVTDGSATVAVSGGSEPPAPCTHENTEIRNAKEATCTAAGYTGDEVCTNCGTVIKAGETIPAKGHAWGDWTTVTDETCTAAGEKQRVCANDETHVEKETIPAKGHAWGEWTVTTEASCTEAGEQQRVCANDETHVEKQTIPAKGHAWGEWTVTKKASCTEDGEQERVCANDETHVEKQTIKALGHDWEEKVIKPATTTEEGEKELTCKRCGEKKTEVIPKIENKPAATTKPAGKNDNPKTGDEMNVALYAGILVLCGAATVAVVSKKKNHG